MALPASQIAVDPATRTFLEGVGGQLEVANRQFLKELPAGSLRGSSGVLANDRAFVRFEQGKVQESLGKLSVDARNQVVGNINSLLNGPNLTPGFDRDFRSALEKTKSDLGGAIDFGNKEHRIALGDNLTDLHRSRQICTGSRIPGVGC